MTKKIDTILADVRNSLMAGNYGQLATLIPALETAEAQVPSNDLARLKALKAEAERTAHCLQAALSGVRAARRRVAEISEAAKGLTTYDREGHKATVPNGAPASRRV
ncbi:hypothetical protein [Pseudotabrizicola alkalilacus]|uniref:Flagellar protein FlgN n=1 Tax=Pseudotabrizicola alkalilacus TaxID=2305252 RepID=A0A411YY59_9RHOB|nr:hypothetical protein [Pseudotabrizicola alkalilacus]RGP35801.1 hypothetical protein D1012_18620 [Pseudotabrizicola alkalilacus]